VVQATWSTAVVRFSHVALILSTFSLLTLVTVMVYLVFQMSVAVHAQSLPPVLIRTH
jgi:hypothetical protein